MENKQETLKLKIWLLERWSCGYDEYESVAVLAEDEASARSIAGKLEPEFKDKLYSSCNEVQCAEGVILGSFNNG